MPIKNGFSADGLLLGLLDCVRAILDRSRSIRDTVEDLTSRQQGLHNFSRLDPGTQQPPEFREACQALSLEIQGFKSFASEQMDFLTERCKNLNSQEALNEDLKAEVEEAITTLKLEGAQLETVLISIESQQPWNPTPGHPPEIDFMDR